MRFSLKVPLKINNSRTSCFALVIASRLRDGGLRDKNSSCVTVSYCLFAHYFTGVRVTFT